MREFPRVILVLLRRPRSAADERRSDPFFEFGSFGCTGCHRRNLLNPRRIDELAGHQLAFAQGGHSGFRLVHLTPPISTRKHADRCELLWSPPDMPFRYDSAPILVANDGTSDFPALLRMLSDVNRPTLEAKFASRFRSRREPLGYALSREIVSIWTRRRSAPAVQIATTYDQSLPEPPNLPDRERKESYEKFLRQARAKARKCS